MKISTAWPVPAIALHHVLHVSAIKLHLSITSSSEGACLNTIYTKELLDSSMLAQEGS